ncbi:hypothetical protein C4544_00045 [candidate division WS5 bacterium]|uniref:Uncharacterized protein n=1 Tax=candidate division WS5 bacterium TaxID=2093353 RepID=A0A419DGU8_9BACT|nr:MAG: hypothetical protein C4544_00045 [candidate division WS5 bacterium]
MKDCKVREMLYILGIIMLPKTLLQIIFLSVITLFLIVLPPSPSSLAQSGDPCENTSDSLIKVQDGLLSAVSSSDVYLETGECIGGNKAMIPPFSILSFKEIKAEYFDKNQITNKEIIVTTTSYTQTDRNQGNITGSSDTTYQNKLKLQPDEGVGLYSIEKAGDQGGDLIIERDLSSDNITINDDNVTTIVFVEGSLLINSNIEISKESSGVVFIVQGDINVGPNVSQIDAMLITYGTFCSLYLDNACASEKQDANRLVINGSIISFNSSKTPQFMRSFENNTEAAEEINYQTKYLIIFKELFSRTRQIWSEITDSASIIELSAATTPLPTSPPVTPTIAPTNTPTPTPSNPLTIETIIEVVNALEI